MAVKETVTSTTCSLRLEDGQTATGKDKIKSISLGKLQTGAAVDSEKLYNIATGVKAFYSENQVDVRRTDYTTLSWQN